MEIVGAIVGLLLLVVGIVGLAIAIFAWPKEYKNGRSLAIVGSIVAIVVFLLISSIKVVGAGEIGIVKHFGAVESNERGPGVNLVMPFLTDITNVDGRVQGISFDKLAAASKEYQDVFLTGTLNIHVNPDSAAELYQSVGLDYKDKLVVPFYTNIVKEIVPQFGIADILPHREQIRQLTVAKLREKLAPYGITVDDVALANVDFNEKYNEAIQNKQVQELQVQTEKNILAQKSIKAEQAVTEAQGQANATIERAKGEAEANRLVAQSLTQPILINRYIEKLNPDVKVMLVPQGQQFLLNLDQMLTNPTK